MALRKLYSFLKKDLTTWWWWWWWYLLLVSRKWNYTFQNSL